MIKRLVAAALTAATLWGEAVGATYVAQVGTARYTSLSSAVKNLTATKNRLTLLDDCSSSVNLVLPGTFDVTIDLAGHVIEASGGSTASLFKMTSACDHTLTISNGAIHVACPSVLRMETLGNGKVVLDHLTATSSSTAGAFMFVVWTDMNVSDCDFRGKGCGVVMLGENLADDAAGHQLTGEFTRSTFRVEEPNSDVSSRYYCSSCVFVHHGSVAYLDNCECFGPDKDSPAPFVGFEANTTSRIYFRGGYYCGPLKADYNEDDHMNVEAGLFRSCRFVTRGDSSSWAYYRISGGTFDCDPATNACKYLSSGASVMEDFPKTGYDTVTMQPTGTPTLPLKLDRTPVGGRAIGIWLDGAEYRKGTVVSVTAEADPGYHCLGWFDENGVQLYDWTTYTFTVGDGVPLAIHPVFAPDEQKKIDFSAEGFVGPYDGQRHAISVTVNTPSTAKVRYALSEEGPFRVQQYYFTNVVDTPSPVKVWYEISVDSGGYETVVSNAVVHITPRTGVVVAIAGHTATYAVDGQEKTVEGYDVRRINSTLYTVGDFEFKGTASVSATDPGTYPMGLQASDFVNTNANFGGVVFDVTDGWLKITPCLLAADLDWKYLKATGTYFAQLRVTSVSGGMVGVQALRFLFADRMGGDGVVNAALWSTPQRKAKPEAMTLETVEYRYVELDSSAFTADGVTETFGVQNLMASTIPTAERTIEMYVRKRVEPVPGQAAEAGVDDFVGYLWWVSGGLTNTIPVVAGASLAASGVKMMMATSAPSSLRVLNLALAVGKSVDEGSVPYCRVVDFAVDGDMISGRVEVGCDDGRMLSPGSIGANAVVTLLGAKSVGGDFEEVGRARTDGTFRFAKPVDFSFFKANVVVEEVVK